MPRALIIIKNEHERSVYYCIEQWLLYKGVEVITIEYKDDILSSSLDAEIDVLVVDTEATLRKLGLRPKITVIYCGMPRDDVPVSFNEGIIVLHRSTGLYMLFRILEHYMNKSGLLLHTPILGEELKPP